MTFFLQTYCPRCQEVYVPRQKHLDIDGAYFGLSFPNILFKTYPDLYPKEGPLTYIPTIYGFKIFGQKGSAFEYKYDNNGTQTNKKEIDRVLNNKVTGVKTIRDDDAPGHMTGIQNKQAKFSEKSGQMF